MTSTGTLTFTAEARSGGIMRYRGTASQVVTKSLTLIIPVVSFKTASLASNTVSAIVTSDGELWTWGNNIYGALGIGTSISSAAPQMIAGSGYVKVAAGCENLACVDTEGHLWTTGNGYYGATGLGSSSNALVPTELGSDTWIDVAVGDLHMVGVKGDGSLWAWGWNDDYNLGDGTTTNRMAPVRIDGSLVLQTGEHFIRVAAGRDFALAVTNQGRLYAWGDNGYGQLGTGNSSVQTVPVRVGADTDWLAVSCGYYHCLAQKTDGRLFGSGSNVNGQLGLGAGISFVQVFTQLLSGASVSSFDAGDYFSLAVVGGALYAFGKDDYGQLGDGNGGEVSEASPVRIGSDADWSVVSCGTATSLAVKADGRLFAWGRNDYGQAAQGYTTDVTKPVKIAGAVHSMTAGGAELFCVMADGSLKGAGSPPGLIGSVMTTSLAPVAGDLLAQGQTWVQAETNGGTVIARRSDGDLFASGDGYQGLIGNGSADDQTSFVASAPGVWTDVSLGDDHVLAVKSDGSLWTWGTNDYGQLGQGAPESSTPYPSAGPVGSAKDWVSVAAGEDISVAVNSSGEVWTWGRARYFGLGDQDDATDEIAPVRVYSPGSSGWKAIKAGAAGAAGWVADNLGQVHAWGYDYYGQLGLGSSFDFIQAPQAILSGLAPTALAGSFYHILAVIGGEHFGSGRNANGELGDPSFGTETDTFRRIGSSSSWTAVACAYEESFALDSSGDLYAFGGNLYFGLTAAAPGNVLAPKIVTF